LVCPVEVNRPRRARIGNLAMACLTGHTLGLVVAGCRAKAGCVAGEALLRLVQLGPTVLEVLDAEGCVMRAILPGCGDVRMAFGALRELAPVVALAVILHGGRGVVGSQRQPSRHRS